MFAIMFSLFFQLAEPHRWGDRPLDDRRAAHFPRPAQHAQGFYGDGTNSGYFKDGKVREDKGHTINDYKFHGPTRDDALMKQAEANVQKTWGNKEYNWRKHNCRDYKNAVNDEYARLAKNKGLKTYGGIINGHR